MGTFNDGDSGSSIRTKLNTAIQKTEGTSAISTIDVNGGAIDGVTIGTNSAVTDLRVDNIKVDGNTISSTDTNGDVIIDPNGTGNVKLGNFEFDADQTVGSGQDNYVLTYDHSSTSISLEAAAGGGGSGAALYDANESSPSAQPSATGANAIAIGDSTSSAGARSFGAGDGAIIGSSGTSAIALGTSYANGTDSFAAAIGNSSVSLGATGSQSIAIGYYAKASGGNHPLALGGNTSATSSYAAAIGGGNTGNEASEQGAFAFGRRAKSNIRGKYAFANNGFSAAGDGQAGMYILLADTTDATATVLTTDNSTAGYTDQIILRNDNSAFAFHGTIVARESATDGTDCAAWKIEGLIRREANAGTTTLVNSATTVLDNTPSWGMALSADTTNGGLKIEVTGAASTNIRWVANISTSEVTYA